MKGETKMKKQTGHVQNRFLNCLRIQIVPGYYEEQRIQSIVDFCKKNKFDNVMLCFNGEDYNVGHMTKEEAVPWVETMKRAKQAFAQVGISVSLQPWMEMGHLSRGRKLKEGQKFVTMRGYNGNQSEIVACPMDENWQKYYLDFYEFLIREIEPEVIWIEDDFRLHNHGPELEYGGCFCEHHMKAYNAKLGTDYTLDEFVDLLFRKNPNDDVKKAFLEVNRESMASLAERIGILVKSIGLGTKMALMSGVHICHSMEGRDWHRMHKGFAQSGPMINRLSLPMYLEEVSMKKYYQMFNEYTFTCRGFLPKECHILPELENSSFCTYAKDSEIVRFQAEASIPLEIEGMTYNIFDNVGNGAMEVFGYGQVIAEIEDYLTAVWESGYSYHKLSGVTILVNEHSAYNRPVKDNIWDLQPDEFAFGSILQGHGISARCSAVKEFKDEVVVLAAGSVYNFSDEQLEKLFKDNHVIMDGKAAMNLIDRGKGRLIGASSHKQYVAHVDPVAYEEIEGDDLIFGVPGYRATAFKRSGDYISIIYDKQPKIKSRVYDYAGTELGYGTVLVEGKHLIMPYIINRFYPDQMHPLRAHFICNYIDSLKKDFVRADYSNIYAYYSRGEENVLILVNPTQNTLPVTRFKMTGNSVKKLYEIGRDGEVVEKAFSCDEDGFTVVDEPMKHLTTKTFIIETVNN